MSILNKHNNLPEYTPVYKQCNKMECEACTELACPVNTGKVTYEDVEPLMRRFRELKNESCMSAGSPCFLEDCNYCPNVFCGVWSGLAPVQVMPELLEAKWQLFWLDCKAVLLPEMKAENSRADVILRNVIQMLEKWRQEGVLEEKLKEYGFDF